MPPASPLDAAVDRLYRLPLDEFTAARNDLARQWRGEEARALRSLAKPSLIAWALNQVYWSARPVYEGLVSATGRLREAQAETLRGRTADLRGADSAHRHAVTTAVSEATSLLEKAGHPAGPDDTRALTAAFEALPWPDQPGRLVRPPAPSGFAAFAGIAPVEPERDPTRPPPQRDSPALGPGADTGRGGGRATSRAAAAPDRQEAAAREHEARQQQAREALERAREEAAAAEDRLREAEERLARARDEERHARQRLEGIERAVGEAERAHRSADREAKALRAAADKAEIEARVSARGRSSTRKPPGYDPGTSGGTRTAT